jgi:outer membrane protein OmpA-like peptidoglycan-associated protein
MSKLLAGLSIAVLTVGASTACASKGFVRTSVDRVNDRVASIEHSVDQTAARTTKNEARIAEVDKTAQAAQQSARQTDQTAQRADRAAMDASTVAKDAKASVEAWDTASRRLIDQVVTSADEEGFRFGKADLPDADKAKLDALVSRLQRDPKNVFIEIEGYTDNVGPKALNEKLGMERAEAVERYLYEQYKIPLRRMNVISLGEDKPVASNTTKAGRAQNRRVVVKVLA